MAATLWGKVYYQNHFAGLLRQEPGNRCVFTYDESYLNVGLPPIAFTLPLQKAPHVHEDGLHPFFDNLVADQRRRAQYAYRQAPVRRHPGHHRERISHHSGLQGTAEGR